MRMEVYKGGSVAFEHGASGLSLDNGYASVFMEGGLVAIPLVVGDYSRVVIYDGDDAVMDATTTFESYQFSMSSYVKDDGTTCTGVTNNSLVFKVLEMN